MSNAVTATFLSAVSIDDPEEGRVELLGSRWVPFDMVFGRVRSRFVMALLILFLLFVFASQVVLSGSPSCTIARSVPDCGGLKGQLLNYVAFDGIVTVAIVLAAVVMGLLNSMHFLNGCGAVAVALSSVLNVFLALACLSVSYIDLARCGGHTAEEYCTATGLTDPCARFIVETWSANLTAAVGSDSPDDFCDSLVNLTDSTYCGESVYMSPANLSCTCSNVIECYDNFAIWPNTTCHAACYNVILCALAIATLWDVLRLRDRIWDGRSFVNVGGNMRVYRLPYGLEKLTNIVPVSMALAFLLNMNYCFQVYFRLASWVEMLNGIKDVHEAALVSLWIGACIDLVVVLVAVVYNVRMYFRHSDQLASVPWEYFDSNSSLGAPEGYQGVSLARVRKASFIYMPFYVGAAWASLAFGGALLSVLLTAIVTLIVLMVKKPEVSMYVWMYVLDPLLNSIFAYVAALVSGSLSEKYLWGDMNRYPRRAATMTNTTSWRVLLAVAASPTMALSRLIKSTLATILGMLSVTHVGTHELSILRDSVHGYYVSILRMERFKLEVDRGGIPVEELQLSRSESCIESCKYCCLSCSVVGIFIIPAVLAPLIFGGDDG